MLAKNNFYTITAYENEAGVVNAEIEINKEHEIFSGHFPSQPVVPGVCMMQIVRELLEKAIGRPTVLKKGDDIKFLAVINPIINNLISAVLKYSIAEDVVTVTATLSKDELVHFKFKGSFQ
jgi:3-hydroxyacyl-[acyl-carrier-protein] dehydratase